jgi:hypothetical protein
MASDLTSQKTEEPPLPVMVLVTEPEPEIGVNSAI